MLRISTTSALLAGIAVTFLCQIFGFRLLHLLTHPACHHRIPPELILRETATSAEQFVATYNFSPVGTDELIATKFLDAYLLRRIPGGRLDITCRMTTTGPDIHVDAPGSDGLFGTTDDLSYDH
jgi:hypothetical protein